MSTKGIRIASKNHRRIVVTGAGGFIGHHLVKYLKSSGHWVRGVDIVEPQYELTQADEFIKSDLREFENCVTAVSNIDDVYNLAADMGGIGYISANHAHLTRNNALINLHMLEAARLAGVDRYLYTSSACVYPSFLQDDEDVTPLSEKQAVPADPEKGYGWEKLFAEQLATYYHEEFGLNIRIVRFHNIYGPLGTYDGGREKAPAAICRKVASAESGTSIEVWGDGEQTRSFCYIDDCVIGLVRIMDSGYVLPLNLGTDELVTVNELVDMVCDASGKELTKDHNLTKPQGVRGRNSDNTLLREIIGWIPQISLREGIGRTYPWIWSQLARGSLAVLPDPTTDVPVQVKEWKTPPR
jgi:nucleoside-diphosphate-sugar epimerase